MALEVPVGMAAAVGAGGGVQESGRSGNARIRRPGPWRAAVSIVLAYGGQVRLLAPAYLRARVLELAEASVAAHKEGGSWSGISRE